MNALPFLMFGLIVLAGLYAIEIRRRLESEQAQQQQIDELESIVAGLRRTREQEETVRRIQLAASKINNLYPYSSYSEN